MQSAGPGSPDRSPTRTDGYAPLRDYSGIGDGRSVALIALDGSIDWWSLPDMHRVPAFAALLDPEVGGCITLAPVGRYEVERHYIGETNVVETVFTTDGGSVRVTDSLNTGVAGRLPWSELARRVEGLTGQVTLRWRVAPGTALGRLSPYVRQGRAVPLLQLDDLSLGLVTDGIGEPREGEREVSGEFTATVGSRGLLGVVATAGEPLHLPPADQIDRRIERTVGGWQDWSDTVGWDGPHRGPVLRSALALKLLLHSPTGSIAAAATTSLPERIGGDKNWDYRYTWVRDTAYTLDAFLRLGLHEEVHAAVAWLLATVRRHGPGLRPFYTLNGGVPAGSEPRDMAGYRGSRPVTDGNDAQAQLQLGPYGDLFQTVYLCVQEGHVLDVGTQRLLADLADRCCDDWQRKDASMWELHEPRHYTSSKISCWQALDRASRLVEQGQLPGNGRRWRQEADRIHAWVSEHCWSPERQAYTMAAGGDDLDAGVLLGARFGFDNGPRMSATIDAVRAELGAGPAIYRYSGMREEEGAFLACSFWAVEALAFTDRQDEADRLMRDCLDMVANSPLLTEMIDPSTGEMLGNLPQALSHLALINAASALAEARSD